MTDLSVVGKSIRRIDAVEKATGHAIFTGDIKQPLMLHAKVLRSPYPHARITGIDTSTAERLTGVRCILTGQDVPRKRIGMNVKDEYILAQDTVRSIGQPVAAVAAETIETAEEALELIEVQYEPLPAVFDPEESMSTNPPVVIHPDLFNYEYMLRIARLLDADRPNVHCHSRIRRGDVEKGFHESDLVMENRFSAQRLQSAPIERHTYIAQPEADGGLTLWASSQIMQLVRVNLARALGMKPSKIRIIIPYVGGGFGCKFFREEPIVSLLALKTGRPVKLVFTREEEFLRGGMRVPMIVYIKDGVKKDGTLVAREVKAILPSGGSTEAVVSFITRNSGYGAAGIYRVPNFKWDAYGVYTNDPLITSFRGFGSAQIAWAVESQMNMLAEKLAIDPFEIRKKNLLHEGEPNLTGEIAHSIGVEQCLDKVVEYIKPNEKPKSEGVWRTGKGFAVGNKYCEAPTYSMARVRVMEDGGIVVYQGAQEIGQGCDTVLAQIAAEEFGIPVEQVKIALSDSLYVPSDYGTQSSRSTYHVGNAVKTACQEAKRNIMERVAPRLGVSPDDLEIRGGMVYVKGDPDRKFDISDLFIGYRPDREQWGFYSPDGEIMGSATFRQDAIGEDRETGQIDPRLAAEGKRLTAFYEYTAKAVEVAVNTETGEVKVLRCGCASDMGLPVNPKLCEAQEEGGMGMGIGAAIYEEVIVKDGAVANPNFTDYRLPSVGEMPTMDNMQSMMATAPHKDGPYGAKGLGEGALIGMDAAIANAVYDAVGVRIKDLPITAEKVLRALKEKPGKD
ncbi:xanthine dehydrogenase family protein molybdopterin-binding subunit [Chloroflexota bacterium]